MPLCDNSREQKPKRSRYVMQTTTSALGCCSQVRRGAVSECVIVSVYLDDYTVSTLGRCTFVAWRVCFVDAQAVQFSFSVVSGIWTTPLDVGGPMSINTGCNSSSVSSATSGPPPLEVGDLMSVNTGCNSSSMLEVGGPMSVNTGWGGSRVGTRSRSVNVGSPCVHRCMLEFVRS